MQNFGTLGRLLLGEKQNAQRELMPSINAAWLARCPSWGCFFQFLLKKRKVLRIAFNGEEVDQNIFKNFPPISGFNFFYPNIFSCNNSSICDNAYQFVSWSVSQLQRISIESGVHLGLVESCNLPGVICRV